jgi:hypothetical protein
MSPLESLPPDLHATLALLLRQRKRYDEVAGLLGIEGRAVHDRAHAALALLAPRQARALTASQREQVGDYLLGQQTAAAESRTRAYLEDSDAGRTWARALAAELGTLAATPLPHIPAGPPPTAPPRAAAEPPSATPPRAPAGAPPAALPPVQREHASPAQAQTRPASPPAPAAPQPSSSRVGGAVILGVLAAAAIVAVVLIVGVGGGGGGSESQHAGHLSTSTGTVAATTGTGSTTSAAGTSTSGSQAKYGKALPLTAPDPAASKAVGVAYVLSEKGQRAFYLFAKGLPSPPSGEFYAVWLEGTTSAAAYPLGSLPPQSANGLIEGGGPLPTNAGSYHRIIVTVETSHRPAHPGPTALGGAFTIG